MFMTRKTIFADDIELPKKLQLLAREQMKEKLLKDILIDLTICKIENWDTSDYVTDLYNMLSEILYSLKNKQK